MHWTFFFATYLTYFLTISNEKFRCSALARTLSRRGDRSQQWTSDPVILKTLGPQLVPSLIPKGERQARGSPRELKTTARP